MRYVEVPLEERYMATTENQTTTLKNLIKNVTSLVNPIKFAIRNDSLDVLQSFTYFFQQKVKPSVAKQPV